MITRGTKRRRTNGESRGPTYSKRRPATSTKDIQQDRKLVALQRQVTRLARADEIKYLDVTISQSISSASTATILNEMVVFAGDQSLRHEQREGQKIIMSSFAAQGIVNIPQGGLVPNDDNNRVRILIVFSPDSNSPLITQVLQDATVDSFHKIKPANPYRVVFDRTYNLQSTNHTVTATTSATPTDHWRLPVKFKVTFGTKGAKCTWLTSDLNIGPRQGSLTMFTLSDSAVPGHPFLRMHTRLRFLDN